MSSPGRAPNKGVWAGSQCDMGSIICTEATEILRGQSRKRKKEKEVVIILENSIDWFCQARGVKRLPRQQANPNSWPSITTWHHSNTFTTPTPQETNQNPHCNHLLGLLLYNRHPSRSGAKACVWGNSHIQRTHAHTHHKHTHAELLQPPTTVT